MRVVLAPRGDGVRRRHAREGLIAPGAAGLRPWRNRTMSNIRHGPRHEHRPRHHSPRYHQGHLATSSQPANLVPQHRCQPSRQRQQGHIVDDVHAPHLRSILRVADDVGHESIATIISHRATGTASSSYPVAGEKDRADRARRQTGQTRKVRDDDRAVAHGRLGLSTDKPVC